MKTTLLFLLVGALAQQSVAQPGLLDNWLKRVHTRAEKSVRLQAPTDYASDTTIDITYYRLKLNIDPVQQSLRGETTISLKANRADLTTFFLDLSDTLKTDSVRLNSQKLQFVHQNNRLVITLDKAYARYAPITVTVYYGGKPEKTNSFVFDTHGKGQDEFPIIATNSEPFGTKDWFPAKNTPADKADSSEVWITAPCPFVSVSNGKLVNVIENASGSTCTKTYQWKSSYPIAAYLISIASSNYRQYDIYYKYSEADSMLIANYVYPEEFTPQVKARIDSTRFLMDFLTTKLGPYPFLKEKYGHAQYNGNGINGMEHQTCSSMRVYDTGLIIHELTHQWFGDKITNKGWEHIWLHEGFAQYSEFLLKGEAMGKAQFDSALVTLGDVEKELIKESIYVYNPINKDEIFNDRTYLKAALVIHMLRKVLGDAVFFDVLKAYMNSKFAYGVATTDDFQAIAEQVSGQNLTYFFQEWIYGENYPHYSYQWGYSGDAGSGYTVRLKLEQTTNTHPAFFTMPIQLTTRSASGRKESHRILNNAASQEFLWHVDEKPEEFIFDSDYNLAIRTIIKGEYVPTLVLGLENDPDKSWTVSPNPATTDVQINLNLASASLVRLELMSESGKLIQTLMDTKLSAGQVKTSFPVDGLSAGVYILRLTKPEQILTKKLVVP